MDMTTEMYNTELVLVEEPTMANSDSITAKFKNWITNHKMLVAIGGGVALAAIITIILRQLKVPQATINEIVEPLKADDTVFNPKETIQVIEEVTKRQYTLPTEPFDVSMHLRNLAAGQHPSQEKISQALQLGIDLGEHQTLVNGYPKYHN